MEQEQQASWFQVWLCVTLILVVGFAPAVLTVVNSFGLSLVTSIVVTTICGVAMLISSFAKGDKGKITRLVVVLFAAILGYLNSGVILFSLNQLGMLG